MMRACVLFAVGIALPLGTVAAQGASSEDPTTPEFAHRSEPYLSYCYEAPCAFERTLTLTDRRNVLSLDAGATLFGRVHAEYERAVSPRLSTYMGLYVVLFDSIFNNDLIGFGLSFGSRVFIVGSAPEGFWFGADLGSIFRKIRGNGDIRIFGAEFTTGVGYTAVFGPLSISFGVGAGVFYGRLIVQTVDDGRAFPSVAGVEFGLRVRSALGIAF